MCHVNDWSLEENNPSNNQSSKQYSVQCTYELSNSDGRISAQELELKLIICFLLDHPPCVSSCRHLWDVFLKDRVAKHHLIAEFLGSRQAGLLLVSRGVLELCSKLFSRIASTSRGIQAAGNQMDKESTQLLGPIIAFMQPCFFSAAPSYGRQTTFTSPLGGLCCSFSRTARKRLEANNSSVYMACTQNFGVMMKHRKIHTPHKFGRPSFVGSKDWGSTSGKQRCCCCISFVHLRKQWKSWMEWDVKCYSYRFLENFSFEKNPTNIVCMS